jgi:hypothetical protein
MPPRSSWGSPRSAGGVSDLDVLGEDQDPDLGVAASDLGRGAEPLVGVGRGHPDVDYRDVRPVSPDLPQQVVDAVGYGDDVDPGLAEQRGKPVANQQAVVGYQDPHGITAVTVVPAPAVVATRSLPSSASTRSASPRCPDPLASSAPREDRLSGGGGWDRRRWPTVATLLGLEDEVLHDDPLIRVDRAGERVHGAPGDRSTAAMNRAAVAT